MFLPCSKHCLFDLSEAENFVILVVKILFLAENTFKKLAVGGDRVDSRNQQDDCPDQETEQDGKQSIKEIQVSESFFIFHVAYLLPS